MLDAVNEPKGQLSIPVVVELARQYVAENAGHDSFRFWKKLSRLVRLIEIEQTL